MDDKSTITGGGKRKASIRSSRQTAGKRQPFELNDSEYQETVGLSETQISEILQNEAFSQSGNLGAAAALQIVDKTIEGDGKLLGQKCNHIHLKLPEGFLESLSEEQKALLCGDAVINILDCDQMKRFQQPMKGCAIGDVVRRKLITNILGDRNLSYEAPTTNSSLKSFRIKSRLGRRDSKTILRMSDATTDDHLISRTTQRSSQTRSAQPASNEPWFSNETGKAGIVQTATASNQTGTESGRRQTSPSPFESLSPRSRGPQSTTRSAMSKMRDSQASKSLTKSAKSLDLLNQIKSKTELNSESYMTMSAQDLSRYVASANKSVPRTKPDSSKPNSSTPNSTINSQYGKAQESANAAADQRNMSSKRPRTTAVQKRVSATQTPPDEPTAQTSHPPTGYSSSTTDKVRKGVLDYLSPTFKVVNDSIGAPTKEPSKAQKEYGKSGNSLTQDFSTASSSWERLSAFHPTISSSRPIAYPQNIKTGTRSSQKVVTAERSGSATYQNTKAGARSSQQVPSSSFTGQLNQNIGTGTRSSQVPPINFTGQTGKSARPGIRPFSKFSSSTGPTHTHKGQTSSPATNKPPVVLFRASDTPKNSTAFTKSAARANATKQPSSGENRTRRSSYSRQDSSKGKETSNIVQPARASNATNPRYSLTQGSQSSVGHHRQSSMTQEAFVNTNLNSNLKSTFIRNWKQEESSRNATGTRPSRGINTGKKDTKRFSPRFSQANISGTVRTNDSGYQSGAMNPEERLEEDVAEIVIRGVVEDVLGSDEEKAKLHGRLHSEPNQCGDNYNLLYLDEPDYSITAELCREPKQVDQTWDPKINQLGYPSTPCSQRSYNSQSCMSGHPWDTFVGPGNPAQQVRPVEQDPIGTEVKQVRQYYEQPVQGGVWYGHLPHPEFPGSCEPEHDMDLPNWLPLMEIQGIQDNNDFPSHEPESPEMVDELSDPLRKVYVIND